MNLLKFKINGFHCDACVKVATMKLKKIEGVEDVFISADGEAELKVIHEIPMQKIEEAIAEIGYSIEKK